MPLRHVLPMLLGFLLPSDLLAEATLVTLDGKKHVGEVARITDAGVVLQTNGVNVTVPLREVLTLDLQPVPGGMPAGKYAEVELTDGSRLNCGKVLVKGKEAELAILGVEQPVKVPLAVIAWILTEAHDPAARQEWLEQILPKRGSQDVLAVKREGGVNTFPGTFGDGGAAGEDIAFTLASNGRTVMPALAKVHGLVFVRRPDEKAPPALCKIFDTQRNTLVAARATLGEDGTLAVTTAAGAKVVYGKQLVARLDFSKEKLAYLSDLAPLRLTIKRPADDQFDITPANKGLDATTLQVNGETFPKALVLLAPLEVVYDLDGKYKDFKFVLGLDDAVRNGEGALVQIEGDGRELFAAQAARVRPTKPNEKVVNAVKSVSVQGVRHLRITVRPGGLLYHNNHAVLADAKVSK